MLKATSYREIVNTEIQLYENSQLINCN